jgi:hypothetical protein
MRFSHKPEPKTDIEPNEPKPVTPKLNRFWTNYRTHLVAVAKNSEDTKPKGTEEYRAAILFEEVLSK